MNLLLADDADHCGCVLYHYVIVEQREVVDDDGKWRAVLGRCVKCKVEWVCMFPVEAPLDLREKNTVTAWTSDDGVTRRAHAEGPRRTDRHTA